MRIKARAMIFFALTVLLLLTETNSWRRRRRRSRAVAAGLRIFAQVPETVQSALGQDGVVVLGLVV